MYAKRKLLTFVDFADCIKKKYLTLLFLKKHWDRNEISKMLKPSPSQNFCPFQFNSNTLRPFSNFNTVYFRLLSKTDSLIMNNNNLNIFASSKVETLQEIVFKLYEILIK